MTQREAPPNRASGCTTPPVRVAFVIDEVLNPNAGTEGQLLSLVEHLDRNRVLPHLVFLRATPWVREHPFDVPTLTLDFEGYLRSNFPRALARYATFLRRHEIQVVQSFFKDANVLGTVGAVLARTPAIVASRRNFGHWQKTLDRSILRLLRPWTTHYLANSRAVARQAGRDEGIHPRRMHVIYNGLAPEHFERLPAARRVAEREAWGVPADVPVVGCVANLRPVKDIDTLIEAAIALRAEPRDVRFVVVGEGPRRPHLERKIRAAGLDTTFLLVGSRDDVRPCLAAFDIAVLPSRAEGFSNSLCEYLAAGLPVVASDVGGNAEALGDPPVGLLFEAGDAAGLVRQLTSLLDDAEGAARRGRNARLRAEACYSRDACMRAHEAFYEACVDPAEGHRPLPADRSGEAKRPTRS